MYKLSINFEVPCLFSGGVSKRVTLILYSWCSGGNEEDIWLEFPADWGSYVAIIQGSQPISTWLFQCYTPFYGIFHRAWESWFELTGIMGWATEVKQAILEIARYPPVN